MDMFSSHEQLSREHIYILFSGFGFVLASGTYYVHGRSLNSSKSSYRPGILVLRETRVQFIAGRTKALTNSVMLLLRPWNTYLSYMKLRQGDPERVSYGSVYLGRH